MSEAAPDPPASWSTTAVVATSFVLGAAVLGVLMALSHPSHQGVRLAELDGRIRRIEVLRASPPTLAYPRAMICAQTPILEAANLRADLEGLTHKSSAALVRVSTAPLAPAADPGLLPVQFSLEMNAAYPGVLDVMRGLSTYSPAILVDRTDIVSKGGFVSFRLAGRVLCRA